MLETDPTGYTSRTPNQIVAVVTLGTVLTVEFGDVQLPTPTPTTTPQLGRLCSLVWFDQNANTVRDGEPLLTNAVIVMRDPSNNVIGTRLTNGTEPYCLDNLPAGTYTVTETNPNGYLSTTPDSVTIAVTLGSTQTFRLAIHCRRHRRRRIRQCKHLLTHLPTRRFRWDRFVHSCTMIRTSTGNATCGEPLLTAALITIQNSNGVVVGTRITNGTEPYCVSNLPSGNYTLLETDPTGYTSSTPNQIVAVVTPGTVLTVEFGDVQLPTPTPTTTPATGTLVLARVVRSEREHGA